MSILRAKNLARGFLPVRGEDFVFTIVLTHDIQNVCKSIVVITTDVWTKESLRHGARRIILMEDVDESSQDRLGEFSFWRVANLITGAVHNDAGMIAIAAHDVAGIDSGPLVEITMIVVRCFCHSPTVEHLIHHQKSHTVTQVEKLRRWRIMGRPNRVDSELFQNLEAALPNAQRNGCSKRAAIVVQAHSFDLEVAAVEPEAGRSVETELADAERNCLIIYD